MSSGCTSIIASRMIGVFSLSLDENLSGFLQACQQFALHIADKHVYLIEGSQMLSTAVR